MAIRTSTAATGGMSAISNVSPALGLAPLSAAEIAGISGMRGRAVELEAPASYLLETTGKNLRSTMVLQCAKAGPNPDSPLARTGAAAVELVHLATLAHDDVVDDGKVRRGADAVGIRFGRLASGFVGGALFARAGELIAGCGSGPTREFARAAAEVCAGQMAEFEDLFDLGRPIERYWEAIEGKTASLFELSAWFGATLGEAEEPTAAGLGRFGRKFGIAFQLADDILDLIASEAETGKAAGKDIQQGVYTLPVLHGIEADPLLRASLESRPTKRELPDLISRIVESGGVDRSLEELGARAEEARAALQEQRLRVDVEAALAGLLDSTVVRVMGPAGATACNDNGRRR